MKKYFLLMLIAIFGIIFFAACSSTDATKDNNHNSAQTNDNARESNHNTEGKNTENDEKIKLTIAYQWGEGAFDLRYKPIEEHLGNVELEFVASDGTKETFEEMFANGIKPDIIVDQNINALKEMDLIEYMDDLIEEEDFDLDMLDANLVDSLRSYDEEGRLVGLPDGTTTIALYYNKEVFDLFGESYPDPDEPMTWGEVMDLAKRMTDERNGVQYIGLDSALLEFALDQFPDSATDPDTGDVLINQSDGFKNYFELMETYYNIPNIEETGEDDAFSQKRAAMSIRNNIYLDGLSGEDDDDLDYIEPYDLAPFPVWPELPEVGPATGTTPMIITNYSEHKEEALEVLETYFSPDILLEHIRSGGTNPPVSDPELYTQYANDVAAYDDKNLDAYYVLEKAVPDRYSKWDDYVDIAETVTKISEGMDVVSAMRELEEESKGEIEDAMSSE